MAITKIQSESLNLADTYAFTGTVTGAGEKNRPAFKANVGSTFAVADQTLVKFAGTTEVFDTDNCYDNSTNYRFTPNVAGKYFVYGMGRFETSADFNYIELALRKNGSNLSNNNHSNRHYDTIVTTTLVDMNGSSDYLELFVYQESGGSVNFADHPHINQFGAYLIST